MIDRIIEDYINNNKRLVVPDFGAFIRKDSGQVVFVEYLKKDDGVLAGLIATEKNIGENAAIALIEAYVSELKRSVKNTGEYQIGKLGRIYMTPSGIYELAHPMDAPRGEESRLKEVVAEEKAPVVPKEAENQILGAGATASGTRPANAADNVPEKAVGVASKPASVTGQDTQRTAHPAPRPATAVKETPAKTASQRDAGPSPAKPRQPVRPRPQAAVHQNKKKKGDLIMVFAILAAVIAIVAMLFGFWVNNGPAANLKPVNPAAEQIRIEQETPVTTNN